MTPHFFNRLAITLVTWALFSIPTKAADLPPEIAREFRGVWVASVFNLNWPSKAGLSADQQKAELRAILDRAVDLKLNAILLQIRPSSDALYASKIEPWSAFLTGKMGQPPSPAYDPLEWAITEAHARGLELHAWFNPFRALTSLNASASENHVTHRHAEWIRPYGNLLLVDPGEPAAREYIRNVILDVVRRYDVDGIHIDDYFYPYPSKDKSGTVIPFPDDGSWQRYQAGGGKLSRGDWRRDNINQFVESTYRAIKAEKSWVKFGISPFGIWRPHVPETIEAKLDAYDQLHADSRRWLQEGWCDYLSPQLYWPIAPAAQSFPVLFEWWRGQSRAGRHVWPGIATERIGAQRPAEEIIRELEITRGLPNGNARNSTAGQVFWDAKSLMKDAGGIDGRLKEGPYVEPALVPACPWLGAQLPAMPRAAREESRVTWKSTGDDPARWWAVQEKTGEVWRYRLLPAATESIPLANGVAAVAIRAVDRFGNAGPPVVVQIK